jgi:hypothetical protein
MAQTLEQRVLLLEEINAIDRLKQEYARTLDRYDTGEAFAALFTPDGVLDIGPMGRYEGRDAIAGFFNGVRDTLSFFLHYTMAHAVDVDLEANTARGTWYMWEPATRNDEAYLVAITYDDEFRKVGGRWLFTLSRSTYHFMCPYDKGWVEQRLPPD